MNSEKLNRALWSVVILIFGISAFQGHGYFHADEHFQIIEYANYFNGNIGTDALSWEFKEQMRPSLQPLLFALLDFSFNDFGGFNVARISRFISGSFFLLAFFLALKKYNLHKSFVGPLSLLIWFIPGLAVRFSAENWAGICFLFGVVFLPYPRHSSLVNTILAGLFLGLSAMLRVQMLPAIIGLYALTFSSANNHIKFITGFAISAGILIASDRIFYGQWMFSPWNYINTNLIEAGIADDRYGSAPFYFYIIKPFLSSLFIPAIIFLFAIVLSLKDKFNNPIVWAFLLFVLAHSVIGHKELRFLFPMLPVLLILLVQACQKSVWLKRFHIAGLMLLFPIMIYWSYVPRKFAVGFLYELSQMDSSKNISVGFLDENPVNPFGLPYSYYELDHVTFSKIIPNTSVESYDFICGNRNKIKAQTLDLYSVFMQEKPEWVLTTFNFGGWTARTHIYSFYKLDGNGITQRTR